MPAERADSAVAHRRKAVRSSLPIGGEGAPPGWKEAFAEITIAVESDAASKREFAS